MILARQLRACAAVVRARPLGLEAHERDEALVVHRSEQILLAVAEAHEILMRNVDPPHLRVALHIAHDVGQLQRDAEIDRIPLRARPRRTEDPAAHESHRRGHMPAVPAQLLERRIARALEIHLHARDQIEEVGWGDVEAPCDCDQRAQQRRRRLPAEAAFQCTAPAREPFALDLRGRLVVDDVVGAAAERVDRRDGLALRPRKQRERNEKVRPAPAGDVGGAAADLLVDVGGGAVHGLRHARARARRRA